MTPPLTSRPDRPLEPTAVAKTTSTQLFGVLYITLTGLVDFVDPNSGPWSLLGRSLSYIIKLAPILWWALPAGSTAPHPEPPNASTYDCKFDTFKQTVSVPEYLVTWQQSLAAAPIAVTDGNTMLLTLIVNGLKPHICKWVPVGCCTFIDDCYKAIVEANNQTLMGFCRSNNAPPQLCPAPGSAHNQVGCRQPCQQENGAKRPCGGGTPASTDRGPGKSLGVVEARGSTAPLDPHSQSLLARTPATTMCTKTKPLTSSKFIEMNPSSKQATPQIK
ncbi:hypothetical protein DSO57_1011108 [Entomophthora muscae]|uniref:Uncharacterized protein n=1 Tax=Entomophthora muscae TaxID=34485 RepID=A0ACC2T6G9_9FUNG|nr:hypothetical protein DSO57_1011108 [Entomophthora muscae]